MLNLILYLCVSDSGVLRRIVYVIYTDCIRQCSGPMYIVSNECKMLFFGCIYIKSATGQNLMGGLGLPTVSQHACCVCVCA